VAELAALQRALPDIRAAGAALIVISPQVERTVRETGERPRLDYVLVRDCGNEVARQFGLVFTLPEDLRKIYREFGIDLEKANGDASWTLPMPARYVVDQTRTIRSADVDPDYTRRTEPTETVRTLRALRD
jgi:peroxiredoxin